MPILALLAGLATLVWGAIYARRGSLVVGCGLMLVAGYVVGHEFWHAKVGPVTVTLDRLVLAGMLAAAAIQWRIGHAPLKQPVGADWLLAGLLALFAASAIVSGPPEVVREGTSVWGRWITSFALPALLYGIVRLVPVTRRAWVALLAVFVGLGVYLSLTAVCEVAGQWSLVFPRYIADPNMGIHFGRARGPALNAASLGIYLTACLWCAWILVGQTVRRPAQLVLLGSALLMTLGIFLTYTRSTWLGLAASGLVVAWFQASRRWRLPAFAAAGVAGLAILAASWSSIVGLQREGTAAEAHHSVDQRSSFTYVSWQMFQDHPLLGVGFGHFYDRKLPYLSDRRQEVELESIRGLDHHNTMLSVLTETGLVGLSAFCAVLIAWSRAAWQLVRTLAAPSWCRAQGLLMLALMVNYLCSALFHDLSLLPTLQWLLFVFAGLTVNLWQENFLPTAMPNLQTTWTRTISTPSLNIHTAPNAIATPAAPQSQSSLETVDLFGMQVARVTMREATERVLGWCAEPRGQACRFVVTPNVDHAVQFQEKPELRAAYSGASLVLADGAPIVLASRLLGFALPERVAGSDLVPGLFDAAQAPLRVFLLGAAPGVADAAAARIASQWPSVRVVDTYSPPLGFEHDPVENKRILALVAAAAPDLLIVGFGAPKQELWVHRHANQLQAKVALCAGATIDFLAGHRHRSPAWMQHAGLEWLHRMLSEPRRLAGRYARDAWVFPQLVWRQWRGHFNRPV